MSTLVIHVSAFYRLSPSLSLTELAEEWQSANTLAALASVGTPVATVLRHDHETRETCKEGRIRAIAATDVVIGDILLIEIGDIVPTDARLLPTYLSNLECDEAILTGESLPVTKTVNPIIDPVCPLGDRTNMVLSHCSLSNARLTAPILGLRRHRGCQRTSSMRCYSDWNGYGVRKDL